jgi:hypothetical protein
LDRLAAARAAATGLTADTPVDTARMIAPDIDEAGGIDEDARKAVDAGDDDSKDAAPAAELAAQWRVRSVRTYAPLSLCELPATYHAIFERVDSFKCRRCSRAPREPALCLVCSAVLCMSEACCRLHGHYELTHHARDCSPSGGLFLLLRRSSVVLVADGLAHVFGSVYVDEHGEADVGLLRGKALYLQPDTWRAVHELVARQDITTVVARVRNQIGDYQNIAPRNSL